MAIHEGGVRAVTVGELLNRAQFDLRIPHYQRPYSWRPETALQLVDDIREAQADQSRPQVPYVLGAIIVHRKHDDEGADRIGEAVRCDVVDGQQRLLTLEMILKLLEPQPAERFSGDTPVARVWTALAERLDGLPDQQKAELAGFIRGRCQVVLVITDDLDEAFQVFDSQNYRGKPLAPHDLLKAHHLREMREESSALKAAVVESWESVKDEDLDRLFSIYLYRIAQWSRGNSAPKFTTADIGLFKGISTRGALPPSAEYHRAAQSALPVLQGWQPESDRDLRSANQARFQLDTPILAGRAFFEMVAFLLEELKVVVTEAFDEPRKPFSVYDHDALENERVLTEAPYRGWLRYVSEIYVAGVLYFANKFGTKHLPEARERLFRWAYALRVRQHSVMHRSIDILGSGEHGAFRVLRDAHSWRAVNQLDTGEITPFREGHAPALDRFLNHKEAADAD